MIAKPKPGSDLFGVLLPSGKVRAGALVLGLLAIGLPWGLSRLGVLRVDEIKIPGTVVEKKVGPLRPELMELPGGHFVMGSPREEKGRGKDETRHPADVMPFWICRTEVTLGQWEAVMGTRPSNCGVGCEDAQPVQNISWEDALAYMNALTERENEMLGEGKGWTKCYEKKEGKWVWDRTCTGYRLPTETEWEYAARAGTTTAYSFGEDENELCTYGNGDLAGTQCDDAYESLAPVGSFQPNAWGLYDMHGNVWEWVWDTYGAYPSSAAAGYAGPEKVEEDWRGLRGGAFNIQSSGLRAATRNENQPRSMGPTWGLRCARGRK